jgi:ankyrin repeat protein
MIRRSRIGRNDWTISRKSTRRNVLTSANKMDKLKEVLAKYRNHPEFLGIELTRADQRGAMDDAPLHIAARKGELDDIEVLVSHGADVNLRGDLGHTPLHYAAMSAQAAAVERLLDLAADRSLKNEFSETPLQVAEVGGHMEIANILRAHRPKKG